MSGITHPPALGKYEVRGTLGKGAMGTVYDGWDPVIDRRVAIKTVRLPDAADEDAIEGLARFKREAQAAGRLNHPNIVGVFDYGETADLAYIVMEFVEGRSLKELLAAGEILSAAHAVRLMQDVLAGLAYSHAHGVVHRDIKPANIMITRDGQAKIADFGIARIEASSMTQAGTVLGTPAYMSPEQFMGQVVDQRTDIYSCGVMVYQLLTGERPFDGSVSAIMHKALTTAPPRPSELSVTAPPGLDAVVACAMARRPEDRFATAAAFAEALRANLAGPAAADPFGADETVMAAPRPQPAKASPKPPPVSPSPRPASKRPMLLGGGAVLAVAAGIGVWLMMPAAPRIDPILPPVAKIEPLPPQPDKQASIDPGSPPPFITPDTKTPGVKPPDVKPPDLKPPDPKPPDTKPSEPLIHSLVSPGSDLVTPMTGTPPGSEAPPPPRSAAAIAAALAASLPGVPCTLARAPTANDGAITVIGFGGAGAPADTLRQAVAAARPAAITWQVQTFDGPYCPALDLLRPLADPRNHTALDAAGPTSVADNEIIPVQLTMPDFAGALHVAYLQHDATVSPLVPGAGYPPQTYSAGARIEFGQPPRRISRLARRTALRHRHDRGHREHRAALCQTAARQPALGRLSAQPAGRHRLPCAAAAAASRPTSSCWTPAPAIDRRPARRRAGAGQGGRPSRCATIPPACPQRTAPAARPGRPGGMPSFTGSKNRGSAVCIK